MKGGGYKQHMAQNNYLKYLVEIIANFCCYYVYIISENVRQSRINNTMN